MESYDSDGWDADPFNSGMQISGHEPMNGTPEQPADQMVPHSNFRPNFLSMYEAQQQMLQQSPMPNMQTMSNMQPTLSRQPTPSMLPFSEINNGYTDCPHATIVKEVANFTHNIVELATAMHTRMTKAEYERDRLLDQLQQQSGMPMSMPIISTPQTAPQLGGRFRNAEDASYAGPETPTRPPPLNFQHYSVPPKNRNNKDNSPEHMPLSSFGSKLTGLNKHKSEKTKARKNLQIKVPGQGKLGTSMAGLPTPKSKGNSARLSVPPPSFLPTPKTAITPNATPLTPGLIGPSHPTTVRSCNMVNKRKMHNLEKNVPPSNAVIPLLPLTDTEIIVYFFQSLTRPIVSLRLYSRNWGPANIADTLNDHRAVLGGYLRNTASVKCTTAIKRGKEKFGEEWSERLRAVFATADDLMATDLMQLSEEEAATAVDFDIRSLTMDLKKHPLEGHEGGIFTTCVKYCVENDAAYTLRNVHELAIALRNGEVPVHPPEPEWYVGGRDVRRAREKMRAGAASASASTKEKAGEAGENEDDGDEDEDNTDAGHGVAADNTDIDANTKKTE